LCQAFRQLLHNALTELFAPKKNWGQLHESTAECKDEKRKTNWSILFASVGSSMFSPNMQNTQEVHSVVYLCTMFMPQVKTLEKTWWTIHGLLKTLGKI
jgi:hypothetical protein